MIDKNPTSSEKQFLRDIHSIAESLKILTNLYAAEHVRKTPKKELKEEAEYDLVRHIIGGDDRK
jgi:hypothetical protein